MSADITPLRVYTAEETRELLQVGEAKLRELVDELRITPLVYHRHLLFFGEEIVRFCRADSGLES
jgi:hypothetical protein